MMWLIPRSDPGALTEYRRPHAGGVSTERGALLPYGPFPRLVMLWMYAECAHAGHLPPEQRNPVSSICDFLVAFGSTRWRCLRCSSRPAGSSLAAFMRATR